MKELLTQNKINIPLDEISIISEREKFEAIRFSLKPCKWV